MSIKSIYGVLWLVSFIYVVTTGKFYFLKKINASFPAPQIDKKLPILPEFGPSVVVRSFCYFFDIFYVPRKSFLRAEIYFILNK